MLSPIQSVLRNFVFDDVIVDCENFQVRKDGRPVSLTPRAFDLLVYLLENHGRVLEKSELFEHVWKEKFVTDNALSKAVKEIRHALGDNADNPHYIETVPRRGYRFIGVLSDEKLFREVDFSQTQHRGGPNAELSEAGPIEIENVVASASVSAPTRPRLLQTIVVVVSALLLVTAVAIYFGRRSQKLNTPRPVVVRNAQITTWTGLDIFPTISPDGNMVAYSSDRSGKFEIYTRALQAGARENQLTSDGQQNLEPSWSPDGKWIAYYSQSKGGIWVMPAGGGVVRQIVPFGSRPSWSHDGTQIAFQSDGLSDISNTSATAPTSTLWILSFPRGELTQLTHAGTPVGGHGSPAWSPDGRHIAFVANTTMTSALWLINLQTKELKRMINHDGGFYDPVYAPDGRTLYLVAGGVWRLPLSPQGDAEGEPEQVANPAQAQVRNLSFSADGKRLVSSLLRQQGNLWSVNLLKGSSERANSAAPFVDDTSQRKTNPLFSRDGKRVAYNVWIAGSAGSVWTAQADGKDRIQLTTEPSAIVGWLPDDKELAIVTFRDDAQYLTTIASDTGLKKTIARLSSRMPFCRLSPDGKTIVFNAYDKGELNLWTYSIGEGTLKQLTFDKELFGFAAWSPDGKWIAGELKRDDNTYVAIVPAEGGSPTILNSDRGQSWTGSWSPDGDKIAFAALRNGIWNVYWISRSTKEQKQLTSYTKPNSFVRYPTWSPLGDQIVYEYSELTGNVWLTELK